jgi:hypothetical protein
MASRKEQWQKVEGSEIYSISSWGRIRNDHAMKIKKLFPNRYGSVIVVMTRNGGKGSRSRNMSRIMRQWMPPQPTPAHGLYHLDGNKTNFHEDNLVWMTNRERVLNDIKHGRRPKSKFSPGLTIKEKQIISNMTNLGISQVQIGKKIGRSNSTVSKYLSGYVSPVYLNVDK